MKFPPKFHFILYLFYFGPPLSLSPSLPPSSLSSLPSSLPPSPSPSLSLPPSLLPSLLPSLSFSLPPLSLSPLSLPPLSLSPLSLSPLSLSPLSLSPPPLSLSYPDINQTLIFNKVSSSTHTIPIKHQPPLLWPRPVSLVPLLRSLHPLMDP